MESIYKFFDKNLKQNDEVILPGCPLNRDSWVKDYLVSHLIKYEEYDPLDKLNVIGRDIKIVEDSDEVWGFWTGDASGSTALEIVRMAKDSGKPFRLFAVKGDMIEELKAIP